VEWPQLAFATTIALRGLANTLNDYHQSAITRNDYFQSFLGYVKTHRIIQEDGRVIPWMTRIRTRSPANGWRAMKIDKKVFYGRGDWYNHSGFADLASPASPDCVLGPMT
jgi:hypothetical protein